MPRLPRSGAVLLALALTALSPLAATPIIAADTAQTFDAQSLQSVADAVAKDLMRGIKSVAGGAPLRLAVQPFKPDVIVDRDAIERLNDAMERALKDAGGSTVSIIDRARLADVWREQQNFQDPKIEQQLKDAGADVLVLGSVWPAADGYALSYKADDLRPGHAGEVVGVMREPHVLPGTFGASAGRPLDEAVRTAAYAMANAIAAAMPQGQKVRIEPAGEATPFSDYVVHLFINEVNQQLGDAMRRQHPGAQAVTDATKAPAPPVRLTMRPTVFDLGSAVQVEFDGETADGSANASVMTPGIAAESISPSLLPLKPQCGKGTQTAVGEAVVSKSLDHDAATLAARSLARARAIADETCVAFAGPPRINDAADAQWALKAIAGGLTTDEHWHDTDLDKGTRVRAELTAMVHKLGGAGVPTIQAALSATPVQADVPFDITLTADAAAYLAVFDWQSDDKVLRLYPFGVDRVLKINPGKPLKLPRPTEEKFRSGPRPGLTTDYEALVVIASAKPLDYTKLAPEVGTTPEESLKRAIPIAELFEALANTQVPLTLTVVPYQIVPKS